MSNDYLWDRSGQADAEVERLERLLGRLRTPAPPPLRLPDARRSPLRWMIPLMLDDEAVAGKYAILISRFRTTDERG